MDIYGDDKDDTMNKWMFMENIYHENNMDIYGEYIPWTFINSHDIDEFYGLWRWG